MKKKSPSTAKRGGRSQDACQPPLDKESDKQRAKHAAEQEKMKLAGRGRLDVYSRDQGYGQAGPSHDGWPALPTATGAARVKCTVPSKSPKTVAPKMARQMQMQQQVQQQAGHLMPMHIFLPLAPMGVLKLYETSQKSLNAGSQEQEHLSREVRATQVLYMHTGRMGQTQMVLMQPAQATRIAEPPVP